MVEKIFNIALFPRIIIIVMVIAMLIKQRMKNLKDIKKSLKILNYNNFLCLTFQDIAMTLR